MRFRATVELGGKTATRAARLSKTVESLHTGKRAR
jgi:hypothetical protein